MKKAISLLLCALLLVGMTPASAEKTRMISTETVIDADGSDGYSGDYVVIYNPSTDPNSTASTGNMAGLIETELSPASVPTADEAGYKIDVDGELAEKARALGVDRAPDGGGTRTSYEVGDTHSFLILNYSPLGMMVEFEVLAKGEHCYIWTPTSSAENVYPLDSIDPSYAQDAADTFDSKFPLMQSSFGDHSNGTQGDGRLNLLYYNIDDGWTPGNGYVGGYFYALDLYLNGLPLLHVDTYPGVYYVSADGEEHSDISRSYGTMVHEYQHLINFSHSPLTDTWLNECMSAAAEEICFPGSSVSSRIQSWINYFYSENGDWATPPAETLYEPSYALQNGYAMYGWDNNLPMNDLLVLYAQVSLFAQYIYSRAGNGAFHQILDNLEANQDFTAMCPSVFGMSAGDFIQNFRVALTANTLPSEYDGLYSFSPQEGYDPAEYHGVENLYDLLCPVVFTGTSCQIMGGGAICVKPVGGVYYPPEGAASNLRYFGITRHSEPHEAAIAGDADCDGSVSIADALLVLRYSMGIETNIGSFSAADVNGDGTVDLMDALEILRIAMGINSR